MASEVMAIEQVLHMNEGVGETSYAKNSLFQKKVMMRAKPILEESINNMFCSNVPTCMKVADLGCSSGPNALLVANNIMDIVNETSRRLKVETPIMFQFFLNDLFGNDFNSIFRSLPEFYDTLKIKKGTACLMNATPGTFYGTLFPPNSIHFFHSSFALHWLSQVPDWLSEEAKLVEGDKGNIYVTSMSPASYAKQFKQDVKLFLRSRSNELVRGGGMLLTFIGRYDTSQNISVPGLIRLILNDMLLENLIEEGDLEHFNVPAYHARADEVREIIKEEGSFSVERLESIKTSWDGSSLDEGGNNKGFKDENERAEFITRYKRAVFEPLLKAHFGEGIVDGLFLRFQNKVVQLLPKLDFPILVPVAVKNSGDYFRGFSVFMVSPQFVLVMGNVVIITLFVQSGQFSAHDTKSKSSESDPYQQFIQNITKNQKIKEEQNNLPEKQSIRTEEEGNRKSPNESIRTEDIIREQKIVINGETKNHPQGMKKEIFDEGNIKWLERECKNRG